jgi:hypothetical protein
MRHRVVRFTIVGLSALPLLLSAQPADAECIEVDFAVHKSGEADYYPLGPDYCVTDTPWNQTDRVWYDDRFPGFPTGLPNGVLVEVWYTTP